MAVHAESSIQLNTIPGYTSLFGGHFVYRSGDTIKQGITTTTAGAGIIQNLNSDPAQWGYNTWIGSNNIQLRRGEVADATLSTNGLVIAKGGVIAGTVDQNGFVYLSSEDYPLKDTEHSVSGITINGYTPSVSGTRTGQLVDDPAWRAIIGTKFGVDSEGNLYANNADISGKITITSGSNVYTKTEAAQAFDANGAAAQAESNAVATASADATSKANAAQAAAEANAAADATNKANAVNTALETYKTNTNSTLTNLQNQVDGQVEVWYYSVDPTTSNPPASSWDTDALKARHEGDLYYNINNGHSWRWLKNGTTYSWQQIPDGDAAAALAKATEAATLAGNKRRIFTTQPTPPYDVGDLWVNGSQVKYCNTSKADGDNYAASDWVLTATDDTKANTAAYEEQYIYISKASGTTSVSQYTTWVTRADDVQNIWTTKRPTYDTNYPVLFVAKQKKTVSQSGGNTCTCTTPIKDDTTTIIDGGHITTGTIDASTVTVANIDANNISTNMLSAMQAVVSDLSVLRANMGSITAGSISKGYNSINFNNIPATLEFKNNSTWDSATQGIKYDTGGLAIKGAITATSLTIGNGATVSGLSTSNINGIDNYATNANAQDYANTAEANASYSVEIEVSSIDFVLNNATLVAHPYFKGVKLTNSTTPALSTITGYSWSIADGTAIPSTVITNAKTLQLPNGSNLNATYVCTISKT